MEGKRRGRRGEHDVGKKVLDKKYFIIKET